MPKPILQKLLRKKIIFLPKVLIYFALRLGILSLLVPRAISDLTERHDPDAKAAGLLPLVVFVPLEVGGGDGGGFAQQDALLPHRHPGALGVRDVRGVCGEEEKPGINTRFPLRHPAPSPGLLRLPFLSLCLGKEPKAALSPPRALDALVLLSGVYGGPDATSHWRVLLALELTPSSKKNVQRGV